MDKSWMNCEDTYRDKFCKGLNEFIEMAKKIQTPNRRFVALVVDVGMAPLSEI